MSGLGRLRRHMATASLCKLAVANASPALRDTRRMAKALALGLKTLAERPDYEVRATLIFHVILLDPRDVALHVPDRVIASYLYHRHAFLRPLLT